jgi:hypothetical protein
LVITLIIFSFFSKLPYYTCLQNEIEILVLH